MSQPTPEPPTAPTASELSRGGCSHCGEPCATDCFPADGRIFCCLGCQTVFALLHENGLDHFYDLSVRPGTRIREASAASQWAFLDDLAVQEKLFDFAGINQAKVTLQLPAIHCVACVWLLENLFKLHPGIGRSEVHFSRREAAITFDPQTIKFSELAALLARIGYAPEFAFSALEKPGKPALAQKTWLQIGLAGFAFGNIMLMSLPFYFGLDSFNGPWFRTLAGWLSVVLALPVVTFSAADFWRTAWWSLRQRTLTLEVPVALGLLALYAVSVFDVLAHRGPGYSDTLCALVFFLLCGRLFQRKTHEQLTFDRDYKGFFPLSVTRLTRRPPAGRRNEPVAAPESAVPGADASNEECVAISQLQVGDRVRLRNGELLPADARLLRGEGCLDYSFVTGESEPVRCAAGSHLYAGGRQVGEAIEVVTTKPVAESYLASLWNHEAFRKRGENDLDSLTNRFSRWFTLLVVGIALAAAAFWLVKEPSRALRAAVSVLMVACPCALALAAPVTHGTAQRLLARAKIYLKNAMVLERLAGVDAIVLDKTGTLTRADAGGMEFQGGELAAEEGRWIASLARLSTHPLSGRIAKSFGSPNVPIRRFKEIPGSGLEGEVAGHTLQIGSPSWLKQCGVSFREDPGVEMAEAGSSVFVAIDGCYRGVFRFENALRPEVEEWIGCLGRRYQLALLSGDNAREAARFGKIFGARAELRFNQTPADKLNFIRRLQARGHRVMMIGDGLNDAGALQQAEVGVAVVERVGVFSPASDVILDAAELPRLTPALELAQRTARIVRAGFLISLLYNAVGLSIAAAGFLSPVVCAILMPLSSATIVAFSSGATVLAARKLMRRSMATPAARREADFPATLETRLLPKEAA